MKRLIGFGLAGMVLAGLMCPVVVRAEPKSAKIKVVTTLFPFGDWAGQVGGDQVEVVTLLRPGASPHTYEMTTRDVKAIRDARVLIYNGSGLDDWVGKLVESSASRGLAKLALAERLPLIPMPAVMAEEGKGEKGQPGHNHGPGDTTTGCGMWLDPMRAVRMVDLIAETLSKTDPAHSDYYQGNAKQYFGQLDRLDRLYRSKLDPGKGGVICFHEDLIYLFRRYGVEVYGVVEPYPGKEPSVEYIRKLTQLLLGRPLRYVLTEPQLSEKPAQVLARQLGVPLVTVDPIGGSGVPGRDSYVGLMTYNLNQLTKK